MKIIRADLKDIDTIHSIVHSTINRVYPKYYPEGAVDFFLLHHSLDNIKKALVDEYILLIECNGEIVGTGALKDNEIKRMFITPEFQGRGYGSILLDKLEQQAVDKGFVDVVLDSSLSAYSLYEKRGYIPIKYNKIVTENGHFLCYNRMMKTLDMQIYPK